jgi:2-polyprenyl-3-methyl-5-hydroxy-6-metoxy-1,4-benzoquinol methylase
LELQMLEAYQESNDEFIETYDCFTSRLVVDRSTGHMRFDPTPSRELLGRYYNGTFVRSEDEPTPEKEFNPHILETIRGLKSYLQSVGDLAEGFTFHDVGCGFGASVWAMRKMGVRATGNEANQKWVDAANPHCGGGVSAEPLDRVLAALPYKVDAFFCAHVLEHVPDPLWQLGQMARHMSDNGVAYLCMPNIHNLRTLRRGVRDSAAYFFPVHLNYFTPKSLAAMLSHVGLEAVQLETRSMFDDGAAPEDCRSLLGWELFMLAAKPSNIRVKRQADIADRCEKALQSFRNSFRVQLKDVKLAEAVVGEK